MKVELPSVHYSLNMCGDHYGAVVNFHPSWSPGQVAVIACTHFESYSSALHLQNISGKSYIYLTVTVL